jgi:DNA-binding transcriptional ArsR family regulator
MKTLRHFTIKKLKEPTEKDLDKDIEWICSSFGFVSSRDQDMTAYRILKVLVNSSKKAKGLTSEELTKHVEPTIGSVIYHLKKLKRAGLVVKLGSVYELRMNSLKRTIEEIEKEIIMTLSDIKKIASDVDQEVGLEYRE